MFLNETSGISRTYEFLVKNYLRLIFLLLGLKYMEMSYFLVVFERATFTTHAKKGKSKKNKFQAFTHHESTSACRDLL